MKLPNDPKTQSPNNPNVVFFGSSKFVIPILEVLRKNFDLSLVLTTEKPTISAGKPKDNLASQGDALRSYPATKYCIERKIPYFSVSNLSDPLAASRLLLIAAPIAVLADFGLIIPQSILNIFPMGIINIHPSLLPKYRGPTPVQTAILNGEKTTGVSIIKLDEEVDHGQILVQQKEKILPNDTAETLYKRLFEKGANLLPELLPKYLDGSLNPVPQNHAKATFTKPLTRQDGFVDISKFEIRNSKPEIERKIRAYHPWPGVWFKLKLNQKEKIIKLLPNNLITQYPNDQFLIQVEGKKPMTYKDFMNGYPQIKQQLGKLLE